jgi:DNA recombination protein RmuC
MTVFEMVLLAGLAIVAVLCVLVLLRTGRGDDGAVRAQVEALATRLGEVQGALSTGLSGLREETAAQARAGREELAKSVSHARIESQNDAAALRADLLERFNQLTGSVAERMGDQAKGQTDRLDGFARNLAQHRDTTAEDAKRLRQEVGDTLTKLGQRLDDALTAAATRQGEGLKGVTETVKQMGADHERRGEGLRQTVEGRLDALRTENGVKLEEMRVTVDEKLQGTLEARLGASFSLVNENLERVHKSVGEMQQIATGVGDLKRVLSNVKSRGTWGETSLGMLLEQVMTPEQYAQNVEVKPASGCRVEFAIKMPGGGDEPVWLPIDAKLPTEDYERLVLAAEQGDAGAVEDAAKALERAIRLCAKDIGTKYVEPPYSTDFGIMFLPTEGLFAEVVRRPGLVDALQREWRVTVAGPTTLMATLVALRSGFRTLAIQQRSSEVWHVLGAVKTEFGKFGGVLDKVGKKLGEAQKVVEDAGVRRRAVDRKLRDVEALPEAAAGPMLALIQDEGDDAGGEDQLAAE